MTIKDYYPKLIKDGFCEIDAKWGHDAFLLPNSTLSTMIRGFLDNAAD